MRGVRLRRLVPVALALGILAVGCNAEVGERAVEPGGTVAPVPEWIDRVYPPPNSRAVPIEDIFVVFKPTLVQEGQEVRLSVDGTDVTTYSETSRDRITFDPRSGRLRLNPGSHTAVAQRVTAEFGERQQILDEYRWSFSFQ